MDLNRLQTEMNVKQHQLSENEKLLQSLRTEIKVYEKLEEARRKRAGINSYFLTLGSCSPSLPGCDLVKRQLGSVTTALFLLGFALQKQKQQPDDKMLLFSWEV